MRLGVMTFGCKANFSDTDHVSAFAETLGFQVVAPDTVADAYLLNSCSVTENAQRDIGRCVRKAKRLNPNAVIGVMGCFGQVAAEKVRAISGVDCVAGTSYRHELVAELKTRLSHQSTLPALVPTPTALPLPKPIGYFGEKFYGSQHARPTIKIQDGCNFKCTFCQIPFARGRSRSMPMDHVVQQVHQAEDLGYAEVILTGIHLAHYGWDLGTDLVSLVQHVLNSTQAIRLRLSTLDPFEISDELLQVFRAEKRLCPHLHIALQSGSQRILSAMRRFYGPEDFVRSTQQLVATRPGFFIGVDVIVGFPGETAEDFQETVTCLEASPWAKLHVFSFSSRPNTVAAALPNPVSSQKKAERSKYLRGLSDNRYRKFLQTQAGKRLEIVLESPLADSNSWMGHSENYLPVEVGALPPSAKSVRARQLVPVRVFLGRPDKLVLKGVYEDLGEKGAEALPYQ